MPLDKSGSKESVGNNIRQLRKDGYPSRQSIAIALDIQRRGHADGGYIHPFNPGLAMWGLVPDEVKDFAKHQITHLAGIPKRAVDSARMFSQTGKYDPSPFGDAIMYAPRLGASALVLPAVGALKSAIRQPEPEDYGNPYSRVRTDVEGLATGGSPPWFTRNQARDVERYGMMHGATPGRADLVPTKVRGGAYVFPADVVSAFGQGNSMAGANALNRMFKMGPYGTAGVPSPHAQRTPMPHLKMAQGGEVPIKVSDGEFLVPPEKVAELGGGDMNHAHDILDRIVELKRKENIAHLMSLPPPRDSKSEGHADGEMVDEDAGNPYDSISSLGEDQELPQAIESDLDRKAIARNKFFSTIGRLLGQ